MAVKTAKQDSGFTLVEVLCVLALLGLTAGLVVLNLPRPTPPLKTEVLGAATLLNLAARQSVIDGKSRGVDFTTEGLEIYRYDGDWVSEEKREFSYISRINISIENQEVDLVGRTKKKEQSEDSEEDDIAPLIHFDATGNVTLFKLSLDGIEESFTLIPDPRGRVVIESLQ